MKITDFKNEDAIDLLADIIDPISEICLDESIKAEFKNGKNRLKLVKLILKNHKEQIIYIFARMHNTPVEEYECDILSLTKDLLEFFNDKELMAVFQ